MDLDECLKIIPTLCYLSTVYVFYKMYENLNKQIQELKK